MKLYSAKRGFSRVAAVALISVGSIVLAPTMAMAMATPTLDQAERSAGLWYLDAMGIPLAKQEGLTGKDMRIAVVDDGVNTKAVELDDAEIRVHGGFCISEDSGKPVPAESADPKISYHRTSVLGVLVGNGRAADGGLGTVGIVPDARIDFFATGPLASEDEVASGKRQSCASTLENDGTFSGSSWEKAMNAAVDSGAQIISVSLSGPVGFMKEALAKAAKRGIVVVASAHNPGAGSIGVGSYPAAGNGTVAVNAIGSDAKVIGTSAGFAQVLPSSLSNMAVSAPGVGILSIGEDWNPETVSGTSYATPLVAGTLALVKQRYPDASMNQVIQSLIHTTDQNKRNGALEWDKQYGYGIISVADMIRTDPSSFQDTNPLFVQSPEDPRCKATDTSAAPTSMRDCTWAQVPSAQEVASVSAQTSPPAATGPSGEAEDAGFPHWLAVVAIGVLVLLIILAIFFSVFFRRKRVRSKMSDLIGHE